MNSKLNIVFFGTPDFVVPVLDSLAAHFTVVAVVTTPDTVEGRKKILTPSPVKKAFLTHHPEGTVIIPEHFHDDTLTQLRETKPDLFVVAAYGKIIPQSVLDIPQFGAINIHPSLLPKYRGPSPIQSALLAGEKTTGVSIILMDEKMDHGPLLSQWEYEIQPSDTFASLHHVLFQEAAERLPQIITDVAEKKISPVPQHDADATYCAKITKEDGYIDLNHPPTQAKLDLMIRAFYPWPTVWTRLPEDFGGQAKKGAILKLLPDKKVQLEGKGVVNLKDFLNGYPRLMQLLQSLLE